MKTLTLCLTLLCLIVAFASAYPKRDKSVPPVWQGLVGFVDIIPTQVDPNRENEVEVDRPGSFIMQDIILPEKVAGKAAPNVFGGRIVDFV